jgi:hypothetical protein
VASVSRSVSVNIAVFFVAIVSSLLGGRGFSQQVLALTSSPVQPYHDRVGL